MSFDCVGGAWGNIGGAIRRALAAHGRDVVGLSRAAPAAGGRAVDPRWPDGRIRDALQGVDTYYGTAWMRYPTDGSYHAAVDHAVRLARLAVEAGAGRIVHVTVAHADEPRFQRFAYFRGKAALERRLLDLDVPTTFVRPTFVFSLDDTLLNNTAYLMRRLHACPVPRGPMRVRPVHADDVAALAVRSKEPVVTAMGPDSFTFRALLQVVRDGIGARCWMPVVPPSWAVVGAAGLAPLLGERFVTRPEMRLLEAGVCDAMGEATGSTGLEAWLEQHGERYGRSYHTQRPRTHARRYPGLSG